MDARQKLHACVLGAIDGIWVGNGALHAQRLYREAEYQRALDQATRLGVSLPSADNYIPWPIILGFCILIFTASSYLLHARRLNSVSSTVRLWQGVGLVGVAGGLLLILSFTILGRVLSNTPFNISQMLFTSFVFWFSVSAFGLVSALNLIYAITIKSALRCYAGDANQKYR